MNGDPRRRDRTARLVRLTPHESNIGGWPYRGDPASMGLEARRELGRALASFLARRLAAAGFLGLAVYHGALACGVNWGQIAWGAEVLPLAAGHRMASAVVALAFVTAAAALLGLSNGVAPKKDWMRFRRGVSLLAAAMAIGALGHLASPSDVERYAVAPIYVVIAVLCLLVARSAPPGGNYEGDVPAEEGPAVVATEAERRPS